MFGIKSKVAILSIVVAGTLGWSNKGTPDGYPNCYVDYPDGVGDGYCSSFYPEHNVEVCGWDGGYVLRKKKILCIKYCIRRAIFVSIVYQKSSLMPSHSFELVDFSIIFFFAKLETATS